MEHWKSPEFQEAEREYAELNQNLLKEVSLTVPAVTEPPNVAGSPSVITPPVFTAPEVPGSPSLSAPMTTKDLGSMRSPFRVGPGYNFAKAVSGCPSATSD